MSETTEDLFLGGRVRLRQPRDGYRAATDPVFLAAATPARAGESVLDLGCGAGAALYCLGVRVPGLHLTGLEVQPFYAGLARENAALNGLEAEIVEGDLSDRPPALADRAFDHVICNPPWYAHGSGARDAGRDAAHRETGARLDDFVDYALRRLRPGGRLTLIQRAERLDGILAALRGRAGDIRILPLAAREGRPAKRVLVGAVKGSRAPLSLQAPLVVHSGPTHRADGDDFSAAAAAVLREAAELRL